MIVVRLEAVPAAVVDVSEEIAEISVVASPTGMDSVVDVTEDALLLLVEGFSLIHLV